MTTAKKRFANEPEAFEAFKKETFPLYYKDVADPIMRAHLSAAMVVPVSSPQSEKDVMQLLAKSRSGLFSQSTPANKQPQTTPNNVLSQKGPSRGSSNSGR